MVKIAAVNTLLYLMSPQKAERSISITLIFENIAYILISSAKTLSSKKNDTKIICFGLVVLILQPFLETQSFTNFVKNLHKLFTAGIAVHKFSLCFVCNDQWASGQQCMEVRKAVIPD